MRTRSIILCAATLLTAQAISSAQKTEVSVRKGQVIAETATESRAVAAGRKAILTADKHLTVTVDDPMVDDVMEIYKWVEAEKQAQREQIDTTTIMVIRIDSEHLLTLAYYAETQNAKSEPSDAHQLNISILEEARFYARGVITLCISRNRLSRAVISDTSAWAKLAGQEGSARKVRCGI
ncbi:MAG: hypothetical protein ACYS76_14605 [Planctomycetota bacterium]